MPLLALLLSCPLDGVPYRLHAPDIGMLRRETSAYFHPRCASELAARPLATLSTTRHCAHPRRVIRRAVAPPVRGLPSGRAWERRCHVLRIASAYGGLRRRQPHLGGTYAPSLAAHRCVVAVPALSSMHERGNSDAPQSAETVGHRADDIAECVRRGLVDGQNSMRHASYLLSPTSYVDVEPRWRPQRREGWADQVAASVGKVGTFDLAAEQRTEEILAGATVEA